LSTAGIVNDRAQEHRVFLNRELLHFFHRRIDLRFDVPGPISSPGALISQQPKLTRMEYSIIFSRHPWAATAHACD
jgi:hypothetical protein